MAGLWRYNFCSFYAISPDTDACRRVCTRLLRCCCGLATNRVLRRVVGTILVGGLFAALAAGCNLNKPQLQPEATPVGGRSGSNIGIDPQAGRSGSAVAAGNGRSGEVRSGESRSGSSRASESFAGAAQFRQYVPPERPVEPVASPAAELPTRPLDARPSVSLLYTVEIWEILLPRDTIASDDDFWKRVDEGAVELSAYDLLFKNGFRVGRLPIAELSRISTLIEERQGKRTRTSGVAGKRVEIPIEKNIPQQTLFYFDRENHLIGRWYERSENLMYFSFETTPREPDRIRLALTPAVRSANKKIKFVTEPGGDIEMKFTNDESVYDAGIRLDLPLQSVLIVAPSTDARVRNTLGAAFMVRSTPAEQLERLIVVIPRAFEQQATAADR